MADRARAAKAIEEFLLAMGFSTTGELEGTPQRVADAWLDELVSGYAKDPLKLLASGRLDLGDGQHGAVVVRDVAVATVCPHHLLPSHGRATVGLLPGRYGVGLGVVAELVDALARRMVLQETLGEQIASSVVRGLDARGAFCKITLVHTCFVARGERQSGASVDTLALAGSFVDVDRPLALVLAGGSGA